MVSGVSLKDIAVRNLVLSGGTKMVVVVVPRNTLASYR
jgi:hypothetical protein